MSRKQIKIHPEVHVKLVQYKDKIHDYMSKGKIPLSWNDFFMILISDWESSRSKCHCGHFFDCDHCRMFDEVQRRR